MPVPIIFKKEDKSAISLLIGSKKLSLHQGDVTTLSADALVCPVDPNLDFRSGVARVISQAAGKDIRHERPAFAEPYGKVVVLPGGNLKTKYIFLTVLLGEKNGEKTKAYIHQAVDRTIHYAEFLRLKSIAFPVLGSPDSNLPYATIAQEMLSKVAQHFQRKNTRLQAVLFSVFNTQAFDAFQKEAEDLSNL